MFFSKPLLAIDIGASSIKLVELSGKRERRLQKFGLELLPPGVLADGVILDQAQVEQHLLNLLKKMRISAGGRRVALSLGGSSVMIKKVSVTVGKDTTFEEQVHYQAEQAFQIDMSELYFDSVALSSQQVGQGQEVEALLVGVRREMVEQYVGIIRRSGMRLGVIECGAFSVANMFEFNYGTVDGLAALVNIGASVTQVSIVDRGHYVYTREVALGGDNYSRRLMEVLNLSHDNAEALKISMGAGAHPIQAEVQAIINELNEQLVSEVQMTINYHLQSGAAAPEGYGLSCIFLTGGGARVLGFDAALAAQMQVPVQFINPFQRLVVNARRIPIEQLVSHAPLFGVAVGLGMRVFGDKE